MVQISAPDWAWTPQSLQSGPEHGQAASNNGWADCVGASCSVAEGRSWRLPDGCCPNLVAMRSGMRFRDGDQWSGTRSDW